MAVYWWLSALFSCALLLSGTPTSASSPEGLTAEGELLEGPSVSSVFCQAEQAFGLNVLEDFCNSDAVNLLQTPAGEAVVLELEAEESPVLGAIQAIDELCTFAGNIQTLTSWLGSCPESQPVAKTYDLVTQATALLPVTATLCNETRLGCQIDARCAQAFTTPFARRCGKFSYWLGFIEPKGCDSWVDSVDNAGEPIIVCSRVATEGQGRIVTGLTHNFPTVTISIAASWLNGTEQLAAMKTPAVVFSVVEQLPFPLAACSFEWNTTNSLYISHSLRVTLVDTSQSSSTPFSLVFKCLIAGAIVCFLALVVCLAKRCISK